MISVVLVSLGPFYDYILDQIKQLIDLNHKQIYIITEKESFKYYENKNDSITLVPYEDLVEDELLKKYETSSKLDRSFRDGFWYFTSLRFFCIHSFMKLKNISDVVHLENDVLLFENCDVISNQKVKSMLKNSVYMPFDTSTRNIASIVYIPNHEALYEVIKDYNPNRNDMENFANTSVERLPIIHSGFGNLSANYPIFNGIFDGAAIGQFIDGIVEMKAIH